MASMTDFRRAARDVSNWGRWGDDDELGTLNFITAEKVRQAASLVRHGKVFPLGVDFGSSGPQGAFGFRHNPVHVMTVDGGDANTLAQYGPEWDAKPGGPAAGRLLRRQSVPLQRRHDHHAAAGGHPVGRVVARLLRRPALQRLPGRFGDQHGGLSLRHREGRRQGHHVARRAAGPGAPSRRGGLPRSTGTRSRPKSWTTWFGRRA